MLSHAFKILDIKYILAFNKFQCSLSSLYHLTSLATLPHPMTAPQMPILRPLLLASRACTGSRSFCMHESLHDSYTPQRGRALVSVVWPPALGRRVLRSSLIRSVTDAGMEIPMLRLDGALRLSILLPRQYTSTWPATNINFSSASDAWSLFVPAGHHHHGPLTICCCTSARPCRLELFRASPANYHLGPAPPVPHDAAPSCSRRRSAAVCRPPQPHGAKLPAHRRSLSSTACRHLPAQRRALPASFFVCFNSILVFVLSSL